jgi:hypothetical protein
MFLRQTRRTKDGKTHSYWSVVENQRVADGRVVQRHVSYLGEISPSQAAAWRKSVDVFDEDAGHARTLALFPEDHAAVVASDNSVVQLRLSEAIRPVFHRDERRVEAHIFIAFLAYCLQVTLQRRLHGLAPGLTARSALEKFAAVQMIDVHLPTTDGRELVPTRYTQPERELQLQIHQPRLQLPPQRPPKITAVALAHAI